MTLPLALPTELGRARAKINLTLHVGRAIDDGRYKGYHPLDSLVVFADVGDYLTYNSNADDLSLGISGPFGGGLQPDHDNLILKAARAFFEHYDVTPKGHFHLEKNLPLASGIGGGSADAAAALRLLAHGFNVDKVGLMELSEMIGADVPVCYRSETSRMKGIGEIVDAMPKLGRVPALLVNPGFAVSTPVIFKAFDGQARAVTPTPQIEGRDLLTISQAGQNDLEDIAISLRPEIDHLIKKLAQLDGCQLSRMSGSGATCFAIFETMEQAISGREIIAQDHTDYWSVATYFGDEV